MTELYLAQILGGIGRFAIDARMDRGLARRALEREITKPEIERLLEEAREIYFKNEVFKRGDFIPPRAYNFCPIRETPNAEDSWLPHSFNYLFYEASFGFQPGSGARILLRDSPPAIPFIWDTSHNILSLKQATVLKELFLLWAGQLKEVLE